MHLVAPSHNTKHLLSHFRSFLLPLTSVALRTCSVILPSNHPPHCFSSPVTSYTSNWTYSSFPFFFRLVLFCFVSGLLWCRHKSLISTSGDEGSKLYFSSNNFQPTPYVILITMLSKAELRCHPRLQLPLPQLIWLRRKPNNSTRTLSAQKKGKSQCD